MLGNRWLDLSIFLRPVGVLLVMLSVSAVHAQNYVVLHSFNRTGDGAYPVAGLTMDRSGNLFGTASAGGLVQNCQGGCGTVFELMHKNGAWVFVPVYAFKGDSDGAVPASRVTIGSNGVVYGTTLYGGLLAGFAAAGVVFSLQPPAHTSGRLFGPWTQSVLYSFGTPPDGANPWGDTIFDNLGNLYGTTFGGGVQCAGAYYCGTVYELTPHPGGWTESILYTFTEQFFSAPRSGVIFDGNGRLYGTAANGYGQVFRLTNSGSQWVEDTIYSFQMGEDASTPAGNVVFDPSGDLYGATVYGGVNGLGAVYELTPIGGGWSERVLYSFDGPTGSKPMAGLTRDAAGNLYGTTCYGGANNQGTVFKLTADGSGHWTKTTLHDFADSEGTCPFGNLVIDPSGNIYGTTEYGGSRGIGVVFEIMP
jgi:uncharacterized repeat protein (TIGR03803 family)